ncbi:MAG: hypothetical protein L0H34_09575, partial [Psychrobacter sp.]|nr:hypothetical protein [Psychrobacter sp.]
KKRYLQYVMYRFYFSLTIGSAASVCIDTASQKNSFQMKKNSSHKKTPIKVMRVLANAIIELNIIQKIYN